jgi:hypothetical protein
MQPYRYTALTDASFLSWTRVTPNENPQGRFEQMVRHTQAHFTPNSIESM